MVAERRVAMVLARNFEDCEAIDPKAYLETRGAEVVTIGIDRSPIMGKKGAVLDPDTTFGELGNNPIVDFDLLLIPGGGSPEYLRVFDPAVAFTRDFVASGKPVASICHGPQLLISAGVLAGRRTTSLDRIRDDVKNAGANYVDDPLVVDGNLISSRTPADLPVFNRALAVALGLPE